MKSNLFCSMSLPFIVLQKEYLQPVLDGNDGERSQHGNDSAQKAALLKNDQHRRNGKQEQTGVVKAMIDRYKREDRQRPEGNKMQLRAGMRAPDSHDPCREENDKDYVGRRLNPRASEKKMLVRDCRLVSPMACGFAGLGSALPPVFKVAVRFARRVEIQSALRG